jgi:hypothetical protein
MTSRTEEDRLCGVLLFFNENFSRLRLVIFYFAGSVVIILLFHFQVVRFSSSPFFRLGCPRKEQCLIIAYSTLF